MINASRIRAVAFDIGGVLVPTPLGEFAKVDTEYGLAAGTAMSLFRGGSLFAQCETGVLPFADFCAGAVAGIGAEQGIAVPAERLAQMMGTVMGGTVIPGMIDLVGEVKAAGLRTALLSNIYRELAGWIDGIFPGGEIDLNCSSYVVGERKPEPGIYLELIKRLDLPPEQIVFVDDFPENIVAARAQGLSTILFTDEAQCRAELRGLAIAVASAAAPGA
ncbi:MAG: HAD family hydrolase [Sporichthyaceae bacterium]